MFRTDKIYLKTLMYALILILLYLLESVPAFNFRFMGRSPELLLLMTITVAFFESESYSAFFGLACGLLNDAITSNYLGVSAFIFMFLGFFLSIIIQSYFRRFFLTYIFITLSVVSAYMIIGYIAQLVFYKLPFLQVLKSTILPKILFTGVCAYPVFFLVSKVARKYGEDGEILK